MALWLSLSAPGEFLNGDSETQVVKSWGAGYPICGSMHLECSWGKGGREAAWQPVTGALTLA